MNISGKNILPLSRSKRLLCSEKAALRALLPLRRGRARGLRAYSSLLWAIALRGWPSFALRPFLSSLTLGNPAQERRTMAPIQERESAQAHQGGTGLRPPAPQEASSRSGAASALGKLVRDWKILRLTKQYTLFTYITICDKNKCSHIKDKNQSNQ